MNKYTEANKNMSGYTKKSIEEMPSVAEYWRHSEGSVLFDYKGVQVCFGRSEHGDYYYHCWTDSSGNNIKLGEQAHFEECKKEVDKILTTGFRGNCRNSKRMLLTPIPFFN